MAASDLNTPVSLEIPTDETAVFKIKIIENEDYNATSDEIKIKIVQIEASFVESQNFTQSD